MSAVIFQIPAADKVLILDQRWALIYPFVAPSWLDLRLGVFISLTSLADNNTQSGLAETLTTVDPNTDRVFMGFMRTSPQAPRSTAFFGLHNGDAAGTLTSSIVEVGDAASRWRYKGTAGDALFRSDGAFNYLDNTGTIFGPEMPADPSGAGTNGHASLFMLRMVRTSAGGTVSNFYFAQTNRGGVLYADANVFTNTPTLGLIRKNLKDATWTGVLASTTFAVVPDAVYFYWPFNNSRLRIHSLVVEKFA
jgi:hypothetical protein